MQGASSRTGFSTKVADPELPDPNSKPFQIISWFYPKTAQKTEDVKQCGNLQMIFLKEALLGTGTQPFWT